MRVKTESRRQAIIAAAAEVFGEMGFDAASMESIAAKVGGSKATLYNYFSSKEELLLEVMLISALQQADYAIASLQAHDDIATGLWHFGMGYLKVVTSREVIAVLRIGIAQGGHSEIGSQFYEKGPKQGWAKVTQFFRSAMEQGKLRQADPVRMTVQLKALYEAGLVEPLLLGVIDAPNEETLSKNVDAAVETFLAAHGVQQQIK